MSVIQEKNKKKWTKDGRSWYFDVYYTDIYGNRKEKKSKLYKTKTLAKDAETDFLSEVKIIDITDKNILFEVVCNEWLEYKKFSIKSSTYYGLKRRVYKHILDFFKSFKLHSIKTNTINNWLEKMNSKGLTIVYLNTIISYLKELLIYARDNYDFDNKVVSKIHKYKIETPQKAKESEWNFWTYEEFNTFINNVDNLFWFVIFNFLYYSGLREGEMIALNWYDLIFEKKIVSITKTYTNKVEGDTYLITDPKTKNSIRNTDLDDILIELLKKHYESESKIINFSKDFFIFGNIKPLSPTTIARNLDKYIQKTRENTNNPNFKRITPHGFRHSHVSLLINLGCDSRDVADRIGDTIEMVEKTYYHMFPNKKSRTINVLNQYKKSKK